VFAAYNAGPYAVARWMPRGPIDADIWVENIPYNETRNYVQRVLEHIEAYSRDQAAAPPRLLPWLAPIDADTASAAAAGDPQTPH
jgi:peptidoglycan lytic transglycosylase